MTGPDAPTAAAPPPERAGPLLLGVRHHGPGSARAVLAALDAAAPSAVLIEGPPEADPLVGLAADPAMRPPVALLAYVPDTPGTVAAAVAGATAFWPLADFSPEWVALRWALRHGVPVRFIDVPAAHALARVPVPDPDAPDAPAGSSGATDPSGAAGVSGASGSAGASGSVDASVVPGPVGAAHLPVEAVPGPVEAVPGAVDAVPGTGSVAPVRSDVRSDPLAALAAAAGHDDPERWWEDVVEHRGATGPVSDGSGDGRAQADDPFAPFEALAEAMTALRETGPDAIGPTGETGGAGSWEAVREAHMRLRLRAARREFGDGVAVVCGAWHVPALRARVPVAADRARTRGLPRTRVELTWVPWSHRRLALDAGYGAGVESPGWYGHLFRSPDRPVERWLTRVAGLLREEGRPVSSAHVIEAVRLAGALAALRGRPLPGLPETRDAVRAVMCDGSDVPLALVEDRLVVGDALGEVPDGAPAVPLRRDLTRLQRRLRLPAEPGERVRDLDLRGGTDAARSVLLHRLRLLGVPWGEPSAAPTGTGTFRETWRLRWEPELDVRVAEAGVWGNTVRDAATARARADALVARDLTEVTALAERCLLARLGEALPVVTRILTDRAALDTDVGRLADALPALARSVRYGDVRGTGTEPLRKVAEGIAARVFVGLPPGCVSLDDEAAVRARNRLDAVHGAVGLLTGAPAGPAGAVDPAGPVDRAGPAASAVPVSPAVPTGAGASVGPAAPIGPADPAGQVGSARPAAPAGPAVPASGGASAGATRSAGPVREVRAGGPGEVTGPDGPADQDGPRARWYAVLHVLAAREAVHGVVRGRAVRLLLDDGELDDPAAARLMGLALSPGTPPRRAAAWLDGFLGGESGGLLLVHDVRLRGLVDTWLRGVSAEAFTDVLPLLRRTFSGYGTGVRRTLGELARGRPAAARRDPAGFGPDPDPARADAVAPVLALLLGTPPSGTSPSGAAPSGGATPGTSAPAVPQSGAVQTDATPSTISSAAPPAPSVPAVPPAPSVPPSEEAPA
ncbi:DUF5682 family protein [Streptomyces sp. JNUCC 64]